MKTQRLKDLKIVRLKRKSVMASDQNGFKINFPICKYVQISTCKKYIRTSEVFYKEKKAWMVETFERYKREKTEAKIIKFPSHSRSQKREKKPTGLSSFKGNKEKVFEKESLTFETESPRRSVPSVEATRQAVKKQPEPGGSLSAANLKQLRKEAGLRF